MKRTLLQACVSLLHQVFVANRSSVVYISYDIVRRLANKASRTAELEGTWAQLQAIGKPLSNVPAEVHNVWKPFSTKNQLNDLGLRWLQLSAEQTVRATSSC